MTEKTCVFGNGPCAQRVAEQLLTAGGEVIIVSGDAESEVITETRLAGDDVQQIEILSSTNLTAISGTCGNYTLSLVSGEKELIRQVSTLIIATENEWQSNQSLYGLEQVKQVLSLSQMASTLAGEPGVLPTDLKHVVFLTGLMNESHPAVMGEIMRLCLLLQSELNIQAYVLAGNLKVAADGLEALYRQTKEAGVFYVKFTDNQPEIIRSDGSIQLEFKDEVTGQDFRLTPDLIVVDETGHPSIATKKMAEVLQLEIDGFGFPQTENVHRLTGYTNRRGVLVAGPARAIMTGAEQIVDGDTVSLAALQLLRFSAEPSNDRAVINTGQCVRCLTCHRLCPYRAIELDKRVTVVPDACERCGICAAECPRGAISIPGLAGADIKAQFEKIASTRDQSAASPALAVFCCSRSAIQAGNLSALMTLDLPENLKIAEVPCAGSISMEHILSAFQRGADGVLILSCHEGNCHSDQGNVLAGRRTEELRDLLPHLGLEPDRLAVNSLAANMGAEFAEIVNSFEQTIKGLVVNNSAKPQRH